MPIEFKHIEMVGRLAKDEEIKGFEDYGRTAVFINKPGDIQYKIKSLSTKNDVAEEQFTGYISSIRNLEFVDDQYSAPEDRVKAFSDFYSKSLFVFSHKIDSMGNVKVDVADVLTRPLVIDENTKFVAIPCFSGKTQCDKIDANGSWPLFREYDNFGEFFQRLVENKTVGRIYNFQINDATSFPEFIVWNDSRKMCAIGPIKSASRTAMDSLMIQINIENYCEINLDDEDDDILEYIVQSPSNPSLIHIAEKKYIDIINRIAQKVEENNAAHAAQAASTANLTKQEESDREQQNSVSQGAPVAQEPPSDDLRELPTEKTETAIFKFFRYHSQKNKLFYRLLKKIIKAYDEKLAHFIDVIYSTLNYRKQRLTRYPKHSLYDEKYIQGLESYLATAEKLKKITNIIKSAEWFQTVKNPEDMFIPHSFAVDSRYGSLYRMYSEMNKRNFSVQLDPQYSYSWKKSSSLYEMWCYICICRSFLQQYTEVGLRVQDIFMKDHLFPFLKSGTKILLENEDSAVEIIYDSVLPKKSEQVKLYGHPLYITGKHTRPDICINMYSKKSGWYVGSFIIECKYRSLKAFWYGNTWSSREQIKAYHNDSKSPLFFNGFLDLFTSSRPVLHVFTFTPDIFDEREYSDDQVTLLTFRPTKDRDIVEKVCERLIDEVSNAVKLADQFYIKINPNP